MLASDDVSVRPTVTYLTSESLSPFLQGPITSRRGSDTFAGGSSHGARGRRVRSRGCGTDGAPCSGAWSATSARASASPSPTAGVAVAVDAEVEAGGDAGCGCAAADDAPSAVLLIAACGWCGVDGDSTVGSNSTVPYSTALLFTSQKA